MTEHMQNQFFCASYMNFFCVWIVHFGPVRWVPCWFSEIPILYCQAMHFVRLFCFFPQFLACTGLNQHWNDFLHTESTPKRFHCWLSQRWTNFRVCSASNQILTIFSWTYYRMLSQRRTNFIAVCVNAETISSQTESMRKRFYHWLSQRRNNFIADWVNRKIFQKLT